MKGHLKNFKFKLLQIAYYSFLFINYEPQTGPSSNFVIEDSQISLSEQKFNFDHVFDWSSQQQDVYEVAGKPIIDQLMQGFNATLLMYGQTCSGKTFTMIGDQSQPGLITRTISELFQVIQNSPADFEFRIKVQIYEIYKEKIKDLLDVKNYDLKVREMASQGFYVQQLSHLWASDQQEIYQALNKSLQNRQVGHTSLNDMSSRSHLLFQLTVIMNNDNDGTSYTSVLTMADLAGSENASKAGTSGNSLVEGNFINKSLLTLSNVINALSEKQQHVPYRESNLTKVLWNGLGKNSLTSLIITCSNAHQNESETLSTLRFGVRAKLIKTQPKINKSVTIKELEIQNAKYVKELEEKNFIIEQLKKQDQTKVQIAQLEQESQSQKDLINELQEQILGAQQDYEMSLQDVKELQLEKQKLEDTINQLQSQNSAPNQELVDLQIQFHVIIEQLNKATEENNNYKEQIQSKDQLISDLTKQVKQYRQEIESKQNMLQTKESQLKSLQQSCVSINTDSENDVNKIDFSTNSPVKLNQEISILKEKLKQEKLKYKQQQSVYESQFLVIIQQNKLLDGELKNFKELSNQFNDKIENLNQSNLKLQKNLTDRVQKVVELQEKYDQLNEQNSIIQKALTQNEQYLIQENIKLKQQLQSVNKNYFEQINSQILSQSSSKVFQEKLNAKQSRINQLELEVRGLKQQQQKQEYIEPKEFKSCSKRNLG
ncbi:hypothetical protein pb186bvf_016500 [Paramecium bursaria]